MKSFRLLLMTCHQEVFALQVDLQGFLAKEIHHRAKQGANFLATFVGGNFQ
jgi:hypothetical protein